MIIDGSELTSPRSVVKKLPKVEPEYNCSQLSFKIKTTSTVTCCHQVSSSPRDKPESAPSAYVG